MLTTISTVFAKFSARVYLVSIETLLKVYSDFLHIDLPQQMTKLSRFKIPKYHSLFLVMRTTFYPFIRDCICFVMVYIWSILVKYLKNSKRGRRKMQSN